MSKGLHDQESGFDRFARGEVDWSWGRREVGGRAGPGAARPAFPLAPIERGELDLGDDARTISFVRPGWQWALAGWSIGPAAVIGFVGGIVTGNPGLVISMAATAWFGTRAMLHRLRARWNDRELVIETWPQRRGRKVARADVKEVRRTGDFVGVVLVSGETLPLVSGRRAYAGDAEPARELAFQLDVPFVDETGATVALPAARLLTP